MFEKLVSRLKINRAKREFKNLEYYKEKKILFQSYVEGMVQAVRDQEKRLKRSLKELSEDEYIQFGIETGFIEEDWRKKQ